MKHLEKPERQEIEYYLKKGHSLRAIGEMLGRSPSTISREVKRNCVSGLYTGEKAQVKSYQRRYWVEKELPQNTLES